MIAKNRVMSKLVKLESRDPGMKLTQIDTEDFDDYRLVVLIVACSEQQS